MIRFGKEIRQSEGTPVYSIGSASRLSGLPIWTLRWIERHRLLAPKRTSGNQRYYSDQDISRLKDIRGLLRLKVNLAGIRLILKMRLETALPAR